MKCVAVLLALITKEYESGDENLAHHRSIMESAVINDRN